VAAVVEASGVDAGSGYCGGFHSKEALVVVNPGERASVGGWDE